LRHLVQQPERALGEHRHRIDDQRGNAGVVEYVGVIVQRPERVQRGAPVPLRLPGPDDKQHLGPVQREQRRRGPRTGPERLKRLYVLADPGRGLGTREHSVTEHEHRIVPMPLQRGHQQVPHMNRLSHEYPPPVRD
jgi:hypothetical protein